VTEAHSKYSASNFEADALCPGRPVMQRGLPDKSSEYADEGTAAHLVLKWAVENDRPASAYLGRRIPVGERTFEVTQEMADAVQTAIGHIKELVGDGMLLSDQKVNYSAYLDVEEAEAWGTLDIAGIRGSTLVVLDYKYGRGVEVRAGSADGPNMQLALYALGLLAAIGDALGPFDDVLLAISQPRINDEPSTYRLTVQELWVWAETVAIPAVRRRRQAEQFDRTLPSWPSTFLSPNDKSCKFCRAKATCPAARGAAVEPMFQVVPASPSEFEVLPPIKKLSEHLSVTDDAWLDAVYPKLDMIVEWTKAVLAEIERRAHSGTQFRNLKIVQGKRGNRAWADTEQASAELKAMRLKVEEMYDLKLITPPAAEKLAKAGVIGPRQWTKLQKLVTQAEGKPHVAPADDPRPAIAVRPIAGDFEVLPDIA